MQQIFTIGYASRTFQQFLEDLAELKIQYLIDVRSKPRSGFKPEFSRSELTETLRQAGLRYVFMGDSLGGRPDDPSCYLNGKVQYDILRERPFYLAGIQRIQNAIAQGFRICLMCSEGYPEECHRSKLIGVSLQSLGIEVVHIGPHGERQSQAEVLEKIRKPQTSLFGAALTSRKAYRPGGARSRLSRNESEEK